MSRNFVAQVQTAVQKSNVSIEALAAELGKSAATLYDELNPFPAPGRTAKLGLEDAIRIMEMIGDTSPLVAVNNHFDLSAQPRNAEPDKPTLLEEILDNHPCIVDYEQAMLNKKSVAEVGNRLQYAINELEQDFVLYRQQMDKVRNIG